MSTGEKERLWCSLFFPLGAPLEVQEKTFEIMMPICINSLIALPAGELCFILSGCIYMCN